MTSEHRERELEVAHAVGWGMCELRFDPRDEIGRAGAVVVGVWHDAPRDRFEHRPMPW